MEHLFTTYPSHLSLDVSTNNVTGCAFYKRIGLVIEKIYPSGKDMIEFATFITPDDFKYVPKTMFVGVTETVAIKEVIAAKVETGAKQSTEKVEEVKEQASVSTISSSEEEENMPICEVGTVADINLVQPKVQMY